MSIQDLFNNIIGKAKALKANADAHNEAARQHASVLNDNGFTDAGQAHASASASWRDEVITFADDLISNLEKAGETIVDPVAGGIPIVGKLAENEANTLIEGIGQKLEDVLASWLAPSGQGTANVAQAVAATRPSTDKLAAAIVSKLPGTAS